MIVTVEKEMRNGIHYEMTGSGKPMLLVHGWSMHSGVWSDFSSVFSGNNTVISVDLRGHGRSKHVGGPYDYETFAADIAALLDSLALQQVTAVGWSMGASILLKMIAGFSVPVDSLVLISGNPSLVQRQDYQQGIPEVVVRRLYKKIGRNYPDSLHAFYDLMFTPEEAVQLQQDGSLARIADPASGPAREAALESLLSLQNEDVRPCLEAVADRPVLVVHGEEDRICVPAAAWYMQERLDNARSLLLPNTGHVPFMTRREVVFDAIADFIGRL